MGEDYSIQKYGGNTADILKSSFISLLEGFSGMAVSEKKDFGLSVSHLLQGLIRGKLLNQLIAEWSDYREKGKIKDDYQSTEQHFECLQEMLDFLDRDSPDRIRFNVIKQIFIEAACEEKTDRNSIIPQQFMKVCRNLSSGEIIVLNTTYQFAKTRPYPNVNGAAGWNEFIASESGLEHPALVEVHEDTLMAKHLLTQRIHVDHSGVNLDPYFRLTTLGFGICQFIEDFDIVEQKLEE
ncbi:MAG: hypothetical protein HGJ93_00760 [Desulfosarcina sp.]|nr:hypothetical protein [Desulfosarcina sp.]MBC2764517.1 hypothetical protein [Desulfosarcina sp.]